MGLFTEYKREQMRINAYQMPDSMKWENKQLRKIAALASNWEVYTDGRDHYYSIAKPNSGAETSFFGDAAHVRRLIRRGYMRAADLTKLGRRLVLI